MIEFGDGELSRDQRTSEDRVDRRTLLIRGGGGLAMATLGASLLGCGGGSKSPAAATTAAPLPTNASGAGSTDSIYADIIGKLPRGGSLNFGIAGQAPTSLNPLTDANGTVAWAASPAHDFLQYYDTNSRLSLSLAERLQVLTPQKYKYTLREGAKFHDGTPVTSQSIKDLFEWIQDPKNKSILASRVADVRVEIVNSRSFVCHTPAPDAAFPAGLPNIPILPVDGMAKQAEHPVGCGPFVFDGWTRDSYVSFKKNTNYWNPDLPRLDSLRFNIYPDAQSGAASFQAGQNDFVCQVPIAQAKSFQAQAKSGQIDFDPFPGGWLFVAFNVKEEPYDDPRVRRAIALVVNRQRIAAEALSGLGQPVWVAGIAPNHPWNPADVKYDPDLDTAKQLLAEAGLAKGFSDKMLTLNKDYFQAMNTIIQSSLAEVGIKLKLQVVDIATLVSTVITDKKFGITTLGTALDPEPANTLDRFFITGASGNWLNYSNRQVDRLLASARRTTSDSQRKARYAEAYKMLFASDGELPLIPLVTEPSPAIFKKTVNGHQLGPVPIARLHMPIAAKQAA
ncbi:MAG: glutathione transport system substrate-binding protein [Solirubrobacteraceae bacterium]